MADIEIKDADMAAETPNSEPMAPAPQPSAGPVEAPAAPVEMPATAPIGTTQPAFHESAPTIPAHPIEARPVEPTVALAAVPVAAPRPKWMHYIHFAIEAVLLIAVIALALQLVSANSDKKNLQAQLGDVRSNPQALVQKQADDLVAKVGALMKLPNNETPTVAAVSDAAAAAKQSAFFANAQNGDKVLMYVKAGEAILYRPSTNKIILVAPLTFNNPQATVKK